MPRPLMLCIAALLALTIAACDVHPDILTEADLKALSESPDTVILPTVTPRVQVFRGTVAPSDSRGAVGTPIQGIPVFPLPTVTPSPSP